MTNEPSIVSLPGIDKYEIYDYPGEYPDKGVGKTERLIDTAIRNHDLSRNLFQQRRQDAAGCATGATGADGRACRAT